MIPNQWYAILESNEVRKGKPIGVTRMGEKMVAWRDARGQATVMIDLCPHRGVALSVGKVVGECIQCPFHGFEFDATGRCTLIPANGKNSEAPKAFQVKTFPTREAHDLIYIWWGEAQKEYPPLPFFEAIDEANSSYLTIRDHWGVHYSRAVENQLDVAHLPFAHHNTIGRGQKTLVNGPMMDVVERPGGSDTISFWFNNAVDQGQRPLKAAELPPPQTHPLIQYRIPNVWHNWLGDKLHVFLAFAPIDDENTMLYARLYQSLARLPGLRELFNVTARIGNNVILKQDKRVVITQQPKMTALRMGEKMTQSDLPIIEFRRRRDKLIQAFRQASRQASRPAAEETQ